MPDEVREIKRLEAHDNVEVLVTRMVCSVKKVLQFDNMLVPSLLVEHLKNVELSVLPSGFVRGFPLVGIGDDRRQAHAPKIQTHHPLTLC